MSVLMLAALRAGSVPGKCPAAGRDLSEETSRESMIEKVSPKIKHMAPGDGLAAAQSGQEGAITGVCITCSSQSSLQFLFLNDSWAP